jgi:O-antigen/teichoic acid export membrane protein
MPVVDANGVERAAVPEAPRTAAFWRPPRHVGRRFSWGVADQAVSSLTNFAVSIYVARTLGAVQFGAFSLAYVTFSFVINASRGVSTEPLMVRFSATDLPTWRRAVASCSGTATVAGLAASVCVLAAAAFLDGTIKFAFLALGLTLPGLMLQDSWRFAFFALGRGSQAFLNDTVWALALLPALVLLRVTGHADVFWCVFAWGAAATVAAAVGSLQARVVPRLSGALGWLSRHRDLGPRYLAENTSYSGAYQLRTYGVGLIVGLAAVGYVQAANTLMGPFLVLVMGMGLIIVPEAARVLRRSPRHLQPFCLLVGGGLALAALAWGVLLLVALPRGLGDRVLGHLWRPTYPLVLPLTLSIMGTCASVGATAGLHALGAARRSLRVAVIAAVVYLGCGLAGAVTGGAVGSVRGAVVATWFAALLWWWQLRAALQEGGHIPARDRFRFPFRRPAPSPRGLAWAFRSRGVNAGPILDPPDRAGGASGRLLVLYGRLLGPLLAGYLLFDKAFAYIHLPGTPLYVGEMVIVVGVLGALAATGYLRIAIRDEPILTLLAAYFLWGLFRFLPGFHAYGINAVRDFALVYYCLFAFLTAAALARSPDIIERLVVQLARFVPWLLAWLPFSLVLQSMHAPHVPFTSISVLTHKNGDVAIAALLALGFLWLFPGARSARSRVLWTMVAFVDLALVATQNRGGLLAAAAGAMVGLAFLPNRLRLIMRAVAVIALGLSLATVLSLKVPVPGAQGRAYSASQLFANVASIGGAKEAGNLAGTVTGRDVLWSRIYQKQVADGRLIRGSGFGQNLATQVGVYDAGTDNLRSPHNSHLDILARMGVVGLSLWIALWLGWYWCLIAGCKRLARHGLHARRQVAVLCLMVNTATLVSSFFDPQLEGAQAAALLWIAFGVGVAVTSFRGSFGYRDLHLGPVGAPSPSPPRSSKKVPTTLGGYGLEPRAVLAPSGALAGGSEYNNVVGNSTSPATSSRPITIA